MSQLVFDEALAAQLETLYRTRDVLRRRRLVREALQAGPGDRVLDVGCGPGFYVAELVEQVGPTGSVTGVDTSPQILELARRRTDGRGNVVLRLADATALPVPDGAFDAALSVQVLEHVADVDAALAELHRAVAPGGRVVIWDVDWSTVSWRSTDPARMARVLHARDGHLAHPSLPRTLAARLRSAGFADVAAEGHTFATTEFTPDAYGAAIVPLVEQYVAGRDGVTEDEAAAWTAELGELGKRVSSSSAASSSASPPPAPPEPHRVPPPLWSQVWLGPWSQIWLQLWLGAVDSRPHSSPTWATLPEGAP